ncbi:Rho GTPase activation protein [Rozella allomycis CSF55]|uniref:Rho GTPase activation protein n=1 Tax=Rozella allomycis (strain CSF55) TaxID=988480 RepID=A0A075ASK6_ROZAC|nr:Rho GTPase-activating protein domain-containing protein [Rozella allomycis CSF55]RKP21106.1 Rho GTPase activation protein [Rozella allomycis CSF55]|eukprot:EPZ33266.1 Rho GTPase-activating protein domain-containing protein [Rozella allomycis CSF55]
MIKDQSKNIKQIPSNQNSIESEFNNLHLQSDWESEWASEWVANTLVKINGNERKIKFIGEESIRRDSGIDELDNTSKKDSDASEISIQFIGGRLLIPLVGETPKQYQKAENGDNTPKMLRFGQNIKFGHTFNSANTQKSNKQTPIIKSNTRRENNNSIEDELIRLNDLAITTLVGPSNPKTLYPIYSEDFSSYKTLAFEDDTLVDPSISIIAQKFGLSSLEGHGLFTLCLVKGTHRRVLNDYDTLSSIKHLINTKNTNYTLTKRELLSTWRLVFISKTHSTTINTSKRNIFPHNSNVEPAKKSRHAQHRKLQNVDDAFGEFLTPKLTKSILDLSLTEKNEAIRNLIPEIKMLFTDPRFQHRLDFEKIVKTISKKPLFGKNGFSLFFKREKVKLFGTELNAWMNHQGLQYPGLLIPKLVDDLCILIEENASTQGIFRIPGSAKLTKELKDKIDESPLDFDFKRFPISPFDMATLLKMYLRELPEPILSCKLYPFFMAAAKYISPNNLDVVVQNSNLNGMDAASLAVVIGPALLFTENQSIEDYGNINKIIEHLLKNSHEIFIQ